MKAFDLRVAAALLTRLPLPIDHARAGARAAAAVWAYPLIGLLIGAAAGGLLALLLLLGVAPGPAAAAAMALSALATGALHEDGLADAADGLGGGRDRAHALEIMRDSRIGAYGAVALGLSLLSRWSAAAAIAAASPLLAWAALAASGAVSRSMMAAAMARVAPARKDGLAADAGRAPEGSAMVALALGLAAAAALWPIGFGATGLAAWIAAALLAGAFMARAARRLGGATGDTLGATQQIAEIAFLAALTAGV